MNLVVEKEKEFWIRFFEHTHTKLKSTTQYLQRPQQREQERICVKMAFWWSILFFLSYSCFTVFFLSSISTYIFLWFHWWIFFLDDFHGIFLFFPMFLTTYWISRCTMSREDENAVLSRSQQSTMWQFVLDSQRTKFEKVIRKVWRVDNSSLLLKTLNKLRYLRESGKQKRLRARSNEEVDNIITHVLVHTYTYTYVHDSRSIWRQLTC